MLERHHQCLRLLATVLAVAAALLVWVCPAFGVTCLAGVILIVQSGAGVDRVRFAGGMFEDTLDLD